MLVQAWDICIIGCSQGRVLSYVLINCFFRCYARLVVNNNKFLIVSYSSYASSR